MISDSSDHADIQFLMDRLAISDCLMRYSRGVDRLDAELIRSCYHEDAIDDHGMFVGTRDEFVDWVITMHTNTHVLQQHCLLNHSCELDGNVAHAETYYMFAGMNRAGEVLSMSGGRYIDRFEKRSGRWAVAHRVCLRDWAPLSTRPDPDDPSTLTAIRAGLSPALLEFMRTGPRSMRDPSDPSYARPLSVPAGRVRAYQQATAVAGDS